MNKQIKPVVPPWKAGKNKFIRFEVRPFDDGHGHTAMITWAIFLNKDKEEDEMVAYVKWS